MCKDPKVLKLLRRIEAQKTYLLALSRNPLTRDMPFAHVDDHDMQFAKDLEQLKQSYAAACEDIVKKQLERDQKKLSAIEELLSEN